ncbi:MAG: DUF1854 domain-containing protein [Armatimonadetes bacterium]|nr:DUF1854 domain-containing protein [Armatimonadota bacterium]MDW8028460.1 DUF1854 domain-containing protein [Armatimonadota bacterium]
MNGEQQVDELVWLDPKDLKFFKHKGILRLTVGEERSYWKVQVYRCFPLTDPDKYISVRDAMNREIGLIRNLSELDQGSIKVVKEELERRYLVPIVKRIISIKERTGMLLWEVETDRGYRRFLNRASQESVEQPEPKRLVLVDLDGNRYYIPDITALDPISFSLLKKWLM